MKSTPLFQQLYGFIILIDLKSIEIKKSTPLCLGLPVYILILILSTMDCFFS